MACPCLTVENIWRLGVIVSILYHGAEALSRPSFSGWGIEERARSSIRDVEGERSECTPSFLMWGEGRNALSRPG